MHAKRLAFGFAAGFLAVLTVHQIVILLMWSVGWVPFAPYSFAPRAPLGVPSVFSLAFWGGIWGIVIAGIAQARPQWNPVLVGLVVGAVFCVLVGFTVVAGLRGTPMFGGGNPLNWLRSVVINGAWGLGAGWFYALMTRRAQV